MGWGRPTRRPALISRGNELRPDHADLTVAVLGKLAEVVHVVAVVLVHGAGNDREDPRGVVVDAADAAAGAGIVLGHRRVAERQGAGVVDRTAEPEASQDLVAGDVTAAERERTVIEYAEPVTVGRIGVEGAGTAVA